MVKFNIALVSLLISVNVFSAVNLEPNRGALQFIVKQEVEVKPCIESQDKSKATLNYTLKTVSMSPDFSDVSLKDRFLGNNTITKLKEETSSIVHSVTFRGNDENTALESCQNISQQISQKML